MISSGKWRLVSLSICQPFPNPYRILPNPCPILSHALDHRSDENLVGARIWVALSGVDRMTISKAEEEDSKNERITMYDKNTNQLPAYACARASRISSGSTLIHLSKCPLFLGARELSRPIISSIQSRGLNQARDTFYTL